VQELIDVGVVGALFGAGNGGNTTYTDSNKDGITNPGSFCTSDGVSSGQICNNHTSTMSDDDGGYIRMQGQAYYTNPVLLIGGVPPTPSSTSTPVQTATPKPTNTPTPTRTPTSVKRPTRTPTPTQGSMQVGFTVTGSASPAVVQRGTSAALTASVKSNTAIAALVDLEVYTASGTRVFQQAWDNRSFGAGQTLSLTATWPVPASATTGTYTVMIGVFAPGWGTLYSWTSSAATVTVN
jgi:hypothetical protein